jgi:hypothetical protein
MPACGPADRRSPIACAWRASDSSSGPPWDWVVECARPGRLAAGDGRTVCAACSAFVDAATWSSLNRQCRNPNPFPALPYTAPPTLASTQGVRACKVATLRPSCAGRQRAAGGKLTCCCIAETAAFSESTCTPRQLLTRRSAAGPPHTYRLSSQEERPTALSKHLGRRGIAAEGRDGTCAMRDWMVSRAATAADLSSALCLVVASYSVCAPPAVLWFNTRVRAVLN